jgi:hypothetical protein
MLEKEGESVPSKEQPKSDDENQSKPQDKPKNFAERTKLIKERKQRKQNERQEMVKKSLEERQEKDHIRQKHRKQMSKHTNKGQPVMGPRINRLLDKIRQSDS